MLEVLTPPRTRRSGKIGEAEERDMKKLLPGVEDPPTGGSPRTSRTCRKRVLDKPTHIHARGLTPTHIQGCHSTDLNEYSSLDQVPSNFMDVERSCDVAKYARLTEPGAVAGSGQVVVVRMSHHGVP